MAATPTCRLHASCVAVAGQGLLITGGSGSGKSTLALQMMALGAELIADDQVIITASDDALVVSAPEPLRNMIEARGLGLLFARAADQAHLAGVVDLDHVETERLPPQIETRILNRPIRQLRRVDGPHFAPALLQFLKHGALNPDA
ncbi:HPr kinase/phosphatase C-terminal domain-containing protein [Phaeobacter sp. JH18-32]|uniref:HPr kinase/phosphorylase n=1 Tax=Phaeobacter TaxID=302485 RepID=UPI003A87F169